MAPLALLLFVVNQNPAPLTVSFTISPVVREAGKAPKLKVSVRNSSAEAIEFMRFPSDACFAQFSLSVALTLPNGVKPQLAGCSIRSWPGVKGTLKPGETEERVLDLATLFPGLNWTPGRYEFEPQWDPKELVSYFAGKFVHRASQTSLNDDHFELVVSRGKVRVEREGEVKLSDGARFLFRAHGHKRTMTGGPRSPLIIHGAFAAPGEAELKDFEASLSPGQTVFSVGKFRFELGKYEYDGFMELTYFGAD